MTGHVENIGAPPRAEDAPLRGPPVRIAYLVQDLSDPAVARRVDMFQQGRAEVRLAGFHRTAEAPRDVCGHRPLAIGRTHDAKLVHRIAKVCTASLTEFPRLRRHFGRFDVIVARNLEMLFIASRLVASMRPRPRLVYECIDLHRLLIGAGPAADVVRALELRLRARVDLVLTSSPAYLRKHFTEEERADRAILVENKLPLSRRVTRRVTRTPPGPPWRIGWFGALRCRKSFETLLEAAERASGALEIVLRGRPSPAVFPDLQREVAERATNVRFEGPYEYPTDLRRIYGEVHFAWCLDFYEEDLNSAWLLPNRLYESCGHLTVPIALEGVETARKLTSLGIGKILKSGKPEALLDMIDAITAEGYADCLDAIEAQPTTEWRTGRKECLDLVAALQGRRDSAIAMAS